MKIQKNYLKTPKFRKRSNSSNLNIVVAKKKLSSFHFIIVSNCAEYYYFEDYEIGHVRTSAGRTITETDIVMHAMHSGDFYPHHVDAEFAKKGPFGQRVAQFSCTFSIGIALTASIVNKRAFTYGFDRLRFPNPVFIGDTIHTKITIKEKKDDPKRPTFGQVNEACEIINQHNKVACYAEHILLVERKEKPKT